MYLYKISIEQFHLFRKKKTLYGVKSSKSTEKERLFFVEHSNETLAMHLAKSWNSQRNAQMEKTTEMNTEQCEKLLKGSKRRSDWGD